MNLVEKKFEKMGARVKVSKLQDRWGPPTPEAVRLDIRKDKKGSFFDVSHGSNVDVEVIDIRPEDRHLLLLTRNANGKSKFLCGHDERDWFVAAIPEASSASNVATAKEALKPKAVIQSQSQKKIKHKDKKKRKNSAYVRQGEWFFIPAEVKINKDMIFTNEPLQRGGGKPHMAQFLYRKGGRTVYVNFQHSNGISVEAFKELPKEQKKMNWRTMRQDPIVYVKGAIRHSDHKTVHLDDWHRVEQNTEHLSTAMNDVKFLD